MNVFQSSQPSFTRNQLSIEKSQLQRMRDDNYIEKKTFLAIFIQNLYLQFEKIGICTSVCTQQLVINILFENDNVKK